MATRKAKTSDKKPAKKAHAKKKTAPDYSAMSVEELAIESGMPPGQVKESLAALLMLGDTEEGIREHLLKKLAERDAKEAAKKEAEKRIADGVRRNRGKTLETVSIPLPRKGGDLVMKELPSGLFMGVVPVTNRQWWAVLGGDRPVKVVADDPRTFCPRDYCPYEDQGEDSFREYFGEDAWKDAWEAHMEVAHDGACERFLEELNELDAVKKSGLSFRLPTAEEWEYACRAGSKGDYCLRDDGVEITAENLDTVSWGDGDEGCSEDDLQPVGRKRANAFGLHDMLGLVGEWTASNDGDDGIYCGLQAKASSRERQQTFENSIEYWFSAMDCLGFRLCADRRPTKRQGKPPQRGR